MGAWSDLAAVPAAVVVLFHGAAAAAAAAAVGTDLSSHTGGYVVRCRSPEEADRFVLVAVVRLLAAESDRE